MIDERPAFVDADRSEEHTSELQSQSNLVCRLLLEKNSFFAHALTVGLNVQFARLATNVAIRQRYGRLTYPFAAFEVLEKHEPIEVDLQLEGVALPPANMFTRQQHRPVSALEEMQTSFQCRALQVAVINAPIFGGQWRLTVPQATMSDRLLDIVVIEDIDLEKLTATIAQFFSSQKQHSSPPSGWGEQHIAHHPAELTGIPGIHHIQ